MDLVISDSSVLIHLSRIDRLDLLRELFSVITIPPAVWHEVVEEGRGRTGASNVEKAREEDWIKIVPPQNELLLRLLMRNLDFGEAEAIVLALERHASILLVDETDARQLAKLYNLRLAGTIGVLLRAYQERMIESFKAELDKLIAKGGFYISPELYKKVLTSYNHHKK